MRIFSKRNLKRVFAGWLALNVILLVLYWPLVKQLWTFSPVIMPVSYGEPANMAEAQAQDIRYLRRILKYDRSFSSSEKDIFTSHLDDMAARTGDMSGAAFYLGVRKAMAIADNGHTGVPLRPVSQSFNRVGASFQWFSDGLYITSAHNSQAGLLGARVVEIEGRLPETVNEELGIYFGGAPSWKRLHSLNLLQSPDLMHAAGLSASPETLSLKIIDKDGIQQDALLPAVPNDDSTWTHTLNAEDDTLPLYLRSQESNFMQADIEGGVYLRPAILMNRNGISIKEALQTVLDNAPDGGYERMVIDLRLSPGGNFDNVTNFSQQVSAAMREDGKIYVITGPQTFSAAIVFAALLKRYASEHTLIIGEPMGDYGQFWAERGMSFKLPNSGYYINYATAYHDWEKGCTNTHKYCFSRNTAYDGAEVSLAPDVALSPTYDDYASGRDIVMDWIVQEAKSD